MQNNNIYLIGIMGCGKTSIGKILAKLEKYKFVDQDVYIQNSQNLKISEIFQEFGEEKFRDFETEALLEISQTQNQIIATGGGVILRAENIKIMQNSGKIVFINTNLNFIINNLKNKKQVTSRPLISQNPEKLIEIYKIREKTYLESANIIFENKYINAKMAAKKLQEILF